MTLLKTQICALLLFTVLISTVECSAQNESYEMDRVKMVPAVDESNMRNLALSMWALYDEAMVHPEAISTPAAVANLVYAYYDSEFEGRHEKLGALQGRQYLCSDRRELDSNNRLLFNLKFDAAGSIFVPDTIFVITNRLQEKEGKIYTVGLLSFGLRVTDAMRERLMKVHLERVVKSRAPAGSEPQAVEVVVPFNLARRTSSKQITGKVMIDSDKIHYIPEPQTSQGESEAEILKALSDPIELKMLQYKKGDFNYIVEHISMAYQIDLNIRRNTIWHSAQTKNFAVETYKVLRFDGTGEKTKDYVNAQKAMNNRLLQGAPKVK